MVKHSWQGDMHRTMIALHQKHGKLVRTGPNEVSVSDIAAIKKIYGAGTKFKKSDWYSVWQGHRKFDLFAERDERIHGSQRRLVSRIYSMDSLEDLEKYVDDAVDVFKTKMQELQGRSVNMGLWVQLFAFDVIGEVTFSKRFGFMDMGQDDGSFAAIEGALQSAAWIGQVPLLYWIHDFFVPVLGNHLGINARHGSLRKFAAQEVANRRDRGSDHRDLLDKLVETQKGKPNEMNDMAVLSMATSNIFAGSDTTAISVRSIIYYLLKNPEYKRKLVEEIDAKKKEGSLTVPVTLEQTKQMPYLQACMYEALRCHPAVGMSLPRVTPAGGIEIDNRFIPAGTIVGVNPWVVHRDTQVFGEDVEAFRPDRCLKDVTGDMERFFFAFGSGAHLSWMEMSKLIPTLFMHFELELTQPEAVWKETCWWFVKQEGVHLIEMDSPRIPYTVQACVEVLDRLVEELSSIDAPYEDGIGVIMRAMIRHFEIDYYRESMEVVYVIIDDESWDWGDERMNAFWRSWRERSQAQMARSIGAGGGEGRYTIPPDSEGSTARSERSAPATPRYLEKWERIVNVANKSRIRADLLLSRPQPPPRPPPQPQPQPPAAESGPQPSTTPGSPDGEEDNRAKRLVKEVGKIFTKRQHGP
ncbi:MAG: hypothetical protein LQ347_004420 [Umbilicaria vellea]|nr:MAG: hypothetical protein LQ347_004420 [Umbilicaria vellea]